MTSDTDPMRNLDAIIRRLDGATFDAPARPMLIRPVARKRAPAWLIAAWLAVTVALIALAGVAVADGYSRAMDAVNSPHMEGF